MTRDFVDLSIHLQDDMLSDPPAFAPKIQYFTHDDTFAPIGLFFPALKKEDLPDGEGWALEPVNLPRATARTCLRRTTSTAR